MGNDRVLSVYRGSIIIQSVLLPSALYGLSFVALAISFICWIKFKDYKILSRIILRPQILCAFSLYMIVLIGFFFSIDFKEALSSLSGKLAFLLFQLII
jgi:glucan phosphoethanolaminetransferase (alkaline phosphatase superfamily)